MSNIVIIGGQWGDEGKGKIVDLLAPGFDVVARYSGGPNAGHTVRRGEKRFALHHIPSGILTEKLTCVIGNGTVIDPDSLAGEIRGLEGEGIKVRERLKISGRAHVILPFHRDRDRESEEARGAAKIGTTLKGVGPAYVSKAARTGVRMVDLLEPATLEASVRAAVPEELVAAHVESLQAHAEFFRPMIADTARFLGVQIESGAKVIFEGAQGTLLDLDHGSYPYVTSSTSIAAGACAGTGVGPGRIDTVVGVFKAYQTRVGAGPFPTEETGATGEKLRERGHEYGTTTGRPRRCGWFDAVLARYAVQVNGMDCAGLTLLDVLDEFDEIRVCTGYRYRGGPIRDLPMEPWILAAVTPEYAVMKGWHSDTTRCRVFEDLPEAARGYIHALEDAMECDVDLISVGPEPEQTIRREVSKLSAWLDASA